MLKKHALLALAVTGTLAACGEARDPVSPASSGASASDSPELVTGTADAGAIVEAGTGVWEFEGTGFFECAGEEVLSIVHAPFTYHLVEMPSGDFVYQETWDTDAVTGTVTGLESGIVWERTNNVSPMVIRSTGGGMIHYTFKGDFVSDEGPNLQVVEIFHLSSNASGELTTEFYDLRCVRSF